MMQFKSHGSLYAGEGITKKALGQIFDEQGYKRPMLFYDGSVALQDLSALEFFGEIRLDVPKEPTYEQLDQITKRARDIYQRRHWDVIVVLGGGSALDIAKAVSVLITNSGDAIRYRGFNKVQKPGIPVLAIPTTLSGSEATNNASFIDTDTKTKMGINGRFLFVEHAVLDPVWLPGRDSRVFGSTWLDALTHAYESLVCVQSTDLTKYISMKALELLWAGSQELLSLQIGAHMAGRALCNSGSGIAGAISYPFGVHYGVPHGIAGGIFLPDVMRFNGEKSELIDFITGLIAGFHISTDLAEYGVEHPDDLHVYLKELQPAFDQNPNPFNADTDSREMLLAHWSGPIERKMVPSATTEEAGKEKRKGGRPPKAVSTEGK